jgi:putative transcriptional regulator
VAFWHRSSATVPGYIYTGEDSKMGKTQIRNEIRKYRFLNDEMTQEELASKVGVTRQTIIAIEKGKYSPSLELAFKIAHVFKVPLEIVFPILGMNWIRSNPRSL